MDENGSRTASGSELVGSFWLRFSFHSSKQARQEKKIEVLHYLPKQCDWMMLL